MGRVTSTRRQHGNAGTGLDETIHLVTDGEDRAGELVTRDRAGGEQAGCREMQVTAADAAAFDGDDGILRTGDRFGAFDDPEDPRLDRHRSHRRKNLGYLGQVTRR